MASSPRKRLPPTLFNQTWHETDTAHLDPNALPVTRVPRGWERKREVKQASEGRAKSIWRRFSLRSSTALGQEDETEEEDDHVRARAVKRRQRMSPKAMEKMPANKRAFKGTLWESRKSVLPRKRSAQTGETLPEEQSESDDTPDTTDADTSQESLDLPQDPSSFTFAMDAARTVDELPDYESLDEHEDDDKLGNILPEDSTFALIFKSPVKGAPTPQATSPKVTYPTLAHTEDYEYTATTCIDETEVAVSQAEDQDGAHTDRMPVSEIEMAPVEPDSPQLEEAEDVAYPVLFGDQIRDGQAAKGGGEDEEEDAEMSEVDLGVFRISSSRTNTDPTGEEPDEVTEASLQLDIQEEYELEGELASQPPTPKPARGAQDIAAGLTLSLTSAKSQSNEHTPKKLHSPPPPLHIDSSLDEASMTLAVDDDTAILKSFLSRAAASKAERCAIITRRSSLENRRDSDVVRHALASPRKALEDMDLNSPMKIDGESAFDLAEALVQQAELDESVPSSLGQPVEESAEQAGRSARRSSRAKKSRLPAPAMAVQSQTNRIAIRRADGSDPVVLKKTDAQELALATRNNTRKNKQGAFMVTLRLLKLQAEAFLSPPADVETEEKPAVDGRRGIRWDETLAYYQEHADTVASQQAEAESLATPDELSLPGPTGKKAKVKTSTDRPATPKVRRIRGPGATNGTPGKGLATVSLLQDNAQEEKAVAAQPTAKGIPKPKATKKPSVPVPMERKVAALETAPDGVEPAKERKSRIAAPKSVTLPRPMSPWMTSVPAVGAAEKEKRTGLSGATPRKGIPAPRIVAPKVATAAVESALPRRRGRKV